MEARARLLLLSGSSWRSGREVGGREGGKEEERAREEAVGHSCLVSLYAVVRWRCAGSGCAVTSGVNGLGWALNPIAFHRIGGLRSGKNGMGRLGLLAVQYGFRPWFGARAHKTENAFQLFFFTVDGGGVSHLKTFYFSPKRLVGCVLQYLSLELHRAIKGMKDLA